jgi:hypothetical protein
MAYAYMSPRVGLGGARRPVEYRSIQDACAACGVPLDAPGMEWLLHASDIHFLYRPPDAIYSTLSPQVADELLRLASTPPKFCVINGDVLTDYSAAFGYGPWAAGNTEVVYANAWMPLFANLAPLKCTTGNHDSAPLERPIESFMEANCPWYVGGVQTWVAGGVHCCSIPLGHGTFMENQADVAAFFEGIADDADIAVFYHQPCMASRVVETLLKEGMLASIPPTMTNRIFAYCGHLHEMYQACHAVHSTAYSEQSFGCTSENTWSGDGSNNAMGAMVMRGGEIALVLSWNGKTGMWTPLPALDRSSPAVLPLRDEGVVGTVLSEYWEGQYSHTGIMQDAVGDGTYRNADGWLCDVGTFRARFPIPDGANRFFISTNGLPTTLEMSNDGSSWTTITGIPALDRSILNITIPAPLVSGEFLWVRWTGNRLINGWGFTEV